MNVLVLYDRYATFTNTVFDHLEALRGHSRHVHAFCHGEGACPPIPWQEYDAVVIHYSLRVALGSIGAALARQVAAFEGLKVLFVQDEYDYSERTRTAIERLGMRVVFSCVPTANRDRVYPRARFPGVTFVEALTGFVPEPADRPARRRPIRERTVVVGYRGRALPYWYGDLGQEKRIIAQGMRRACEARAIACDIEWDDAHRIYGPAWLEFLGSCKATLGTESGANVFDDDGALRSRFARFLSRHPGASYAEARRAVLGDHPESTIMNQISPRAFEAIACGTALVLFEGHYSGILEPDRHFIALRKDFGNVEHVLDALGDDVRLQATADRAYADIVESGKFSFAAFVESYDATLEKHAPRTPHAQPRRVSFTGPIRPAPERTSVARLPSWLERLWQLTPQALRARVKPMARKAWDRLGMG
jgi:hypothetical protein